MATLEIAIEVDGVSRDSVVNDDFGLDDFEDALKSIFVQSYGVSYDDISVGVSLDEDGQEEF